MRTRYVTCLITAAFAVSTLSGCATVDLNEMAASSASAKTQTTKRANVVERAASKLYAAFTNRGFVAKTSRKRMRSATRILLEGLEDASVTPVAGETSYAERALPASVVETDILFAASHVEQTTRAAEVYLEMSPSTDSLRKELSSLETALMASREASRAFKSAGGTTAQITELDARIDDLGRVTDEFGLRVRRKAGEELSASRAAEQS